MNGLRTLQGELLSRGYGGRLLLEEPLSRHTSFAIGGPADLFIAVREPEECVELVQLARAVEVPALLLGGGTNILVADAGVRGLVIANECRQYALREDGWVVARSGTALHHLARWSLTQGLSGLEWAVGIPGTVGGATVGNAGAYGGCLADVLRWAMVLTPTGTVEQVSVAALGLGYRNSALKREPRAQRQVLLEVALQLVPGEAQELARKAEGFMAQRKARTPEGCCAGSIFKRTAQHPAGYLVEKAGLKGRRIGGAEVSPVHANFIMNAGGATAADVRALVETVQREVWAAYAEHLEIEIEYVGAWS